MPEVPPLPETTSEEARHIQQYSKTILKRHKHEKSIWKAKISKWHLTQYSLFIWLCTGFLSTQNCAFECTKVETLKHTVSCMDSNKLQKESEQRQLINSQILIYRQGRMALNRADPRHFVIPNGYITPLMRCCALGSLAMRGRRCFF